MGQAKAKVTAKLLRQMEEQPKHNNQPCEICKGNNSVTVLHHIIPVERVARLINAGIIDIYTPRQTVWLCPTCHAYVHWFARMYDKNIMNVEPLMDKIRQEANIEIAVGVANLFIAMREEESEFYR